MTKTLLRTIATTCSSVTPSERQGLFVIIDKGYVQPPVLLTEPHLLTADLSAAWLGISTDSFARARLEHPAYLTPNEIYPGHKRWSKMQLLTFANRHIATPTLHARSEPEKDAELCP